MGVILSKAHRANDDRVALMEMLVHAAAMLRMGELQGVTISLTTADGRTYGQAYLAPGASGLTLLADQIRLLDK